MTVHHTRGLNRAHLPARPHAEQRDPLLVVLLGVLLLARLTGDPTALYLREVGDTGARAEFASVTGSTRPIWKQLLDYLGGWCGSTWAPRCARGVGGGDGPAGVPGDVIAGVVTMVLAVSRHRGGSWAAYRPNSMADRVSSFLSHDHASVPDFLVRHHRVWILAVCRRCCPPRARTTACCPGCCLAT